MRLEIVRDVASLAALQGPWRALLDRAAAPSAMKTPTWMLAWLRQFEGDGGRRVASMAFYEGDELVGLLPLTLRTLHARDLLPIRRLETIGTGESEADEICSDYAGAIVARDRVDAVADAAATALGSEAPGGFDELAMPLMDAKDPFVMPFAAALATRGMPARFVDECACLHVPLPKTFDAYLQSLHRDQRYVVSRAVRELEKWAGAGGYRMVRATNAAELAEGRRVLHELHGERWSERADGYAGAFASARFTAFHDEVMPALLAGGVDGRLDLWWLLVKDRPVAAIYNIVYRGKVYFYQGGRALDVPKNVKVGVAAHVLAMRAAIDEGLVDYDFLAGESQYKRQLALAARPLTKLVATGPSVRARAVERVGSGLEHAADFMRRHLVELRDRLARDQAAGAGVRKLVIGSIERYVHSSRPSAPRKGSTEATRPTS